MQNQGRVGAVQKLAEAKRRFAQWRRQRRGRERIPQELWSLAVEVAAAGGVCATARALRLNAGELKARMVGKEPGGVQPARFVELPAFSMGAAAECMLEAEDGSGKKLRVHLKGQATAQAETIGRMLWREEA